MLSRLFLASEIASVLVKLPKLANFLPENTKVLFVENAAVPYGNPNELSWVKNDREAFLKMGFEVEILDILSFKSEQEIETKLSSFEIIHFCGGNTLYLNYLIHKTRLYSILKEKVTNGKIIYTGTSAGSMVASPDLYEIKNSLLEEIDSKYIEGIERKDYIGLNLVPFLIIPHTNNPDFIPDNIQTIQNLPKYKHPLITLADGQAVWCEGGKFGIVEV